MDKTMETIMGWIITVMVPILVLQLQSRSEAHKHRQDLAIQQSRRDQVIQASIDTLKSTTDKSQAVLEDVREDIQEVRERLIRVETKISP